MTSADLVRAGAMFLALGVVPLLLPGCGGESGNSNSGRSSGDTKAVPMTPLIGISYRQTPRMFP